MTAGGVAVWDTGSALLQVPNAWWNTFRTAVRRLPAAAQLLQGRYVEPARVTLAQWPTLAFRCVACEGWG